MQDLLTLLFVLIAIPLLVLFGVYCFYLVLVATHEAGHLLACKLVGFPWNLVIIGPLKIEKTNGKVRFSRSGQGYDGRVCSDFVGANLSSGRNMIVLLGGASMNLLCGALSFTAILLVPAHMGYLKFLLILFAIGSLVTAAVNALPIKIGEEVSGWLHGAGVAAYKSRAYKNGPE